MKRLGLVVVVLIVAVVLNRPATSQDNYEERIASLETRVAVLEGGNRKTAVPANTPRVVARETPGAASTVDDPQAAEPSTPSGIGERIDVEGFTAVVTGTAMTSTVGNEYLSEAARGVYLVVYVTVTNTRQAPAEFPYDSFTLTDRGGRAFTPDSNAIITLLNMELDLSMYDELQPGLPYPAAIVFDVPFDAKGFSLVAEVSNTSIPLDR